METKNYFSTDAAGNILPSATCYLYIAGTTDLATGITNINDAPLSNPFTAQTSGLVQFKAPDGEYDLRVTKGGRDFTIRIQCFDVNEIVGGRQYRWSAAYVAKNGGYPKGSVLQSNDGLNSYVSLIDSNTVDFNVTPESIGVGWGFYGGRSLADPTKGASLVGSILPNDGAVGRTQASINADKISSRDFGLIGDGSNETTKLQKALNAASGKVLTLEPGKTYGYTSLTIPSNVTLISSGSGFSRMSASVSAGITINSGADIGALIITTPGGSGGDRAVRIVGSNVKIGVFSVNALVDASNDNGSAALTIGSNPAGTQLTNIDIGVMDVTRMSTTVDVTYVTRMKVGASISTHYRTAYYLKDVSNSEFNNAECKLLGGAVNGRPGENGLLLESSLSSGGSHDLTFNNWSVQDSGEHAYRLGGQLAIKNVTFNSCVAVRPGSSILSGNLTSGEWHGGSGFKVLGGNTTITEFHEDIFFNDCGVIDCNVTYGTYPAGHGVNNFQPFLVVMAKNVHLDNCWTKAVAQPFVSRFGILATACDGLFLDGCNFRAVELVPLRPYEETPVAGYPGSDLPLINFYVTGGLYEIQTTTPGNGIGLNMADNAKYAHKNWVLDGVNIRGGAQAARIEAVSTGSYENINLGFNYGGSNVNESAYSTPVVSGPAYALAKTIAPWRAAASTPSVIDGSEWTGTNDGRIRRKGMGAWVLDLTTYKFSLATDSFTTVVPPAADTGFIFITGDGIATQMMGWYRATASPASSKYSGAATAAMVNTALTGTTGAAGNITIGVQNNLIYIENRNGSTNTFKITFI